MNFISDKAASITPYTPGEQPKLANLVKLNTNENPYPPAANVIKAIQDAAAQLHLYPDPAFTQLRKAAASFYKVAPEHIFAGNGSDEVLALAFLALFNPNDEPILFPDITYSFYPVYAQLYNIAYRRVALDAEFKIVTQDYCTPNGGVLLANPNAPTGIYKPLEEIIPILEYNLARNRVVVLDEAYIAFGGQSAAALIKQYPNLLVVTTLSKSHSLAGLRVGFAFGQPHLIAALEAIKNSFNSYPISRTGQAGAAAALWDGTTFATNLQNILTARNYFVQQMQQLGFTVLPSAANFVFVQHNTMPAAQLFNQLRKRNILVRHFPSARTENFLRITIGTMEEMVFVASQLKEITL